MRPRTDALAKRSGLRAHLEHRVKLAAAVPRCAGQLSSDDTTVPVIGLPVPLLRTISIPAEDADHEHAHARAAAAENSELEAQQQQSAPQAATHTAHPSPSPRTALAATFAAAGFVLPVEPAETDEKEQEKDLAPAAAGRKPSPRTAEDSSDSGSDGGDSDSDSSSDEDSDDEDDEAELTPQQAAAIAAATAAICIIHAIPPRRVRGILATANSRAGLTRNLSASVVHQRKKGLRWNVTEGLWSERAPAPAAQPSMARQLSGGPTSAAGAFQRILVAKNAGERWIGHTSKKQRSPGSTSSSLAPASHAIHAGEGEASGPPTLSLPATSAAATTSTTTAAAALPAGSPPPSPMHASPAAAAHSSPASIAAAPRQYTSSARTAGASSFKARIQQGSSDHRGSSHHDSPSLSHTLSTSSNFLLKLSANQIINLSWVALQQLFLIYSKAARTNRDKLAGTGSHAGGGSSGASAKHKSHRVGGSKDLNGSHTHGHHGHHGSAAERSISSTSGSLGSSSLFSHHAVGAGLLAPGPAFLLACGIDPSASSPPTAAQVSQASTWVDLDGGVIMTLDEMNVLALHLVQRKLELCAKELAMRPEVTTGRIKLVALLKDARWMLFPGALAAASAGASATALGSEKPSPRIGGGLDSMGHATLVPPSPSTAAAVHGATGSSVFSFMHGGGSSASPHPSPSHGAATPMLSPPAHAALLPESQITDAFVRATVVCMQSRLTSTNFGEISWGPTMDHWKEFARFFFLFRADTNPTGSTPEAAAATAASKAAEGSKANAKEKLGKQKEGKCSIM